MSYPPPLFSSTITEMTEEIVKQIHSSSGKSREEPTSRSHWKDFLKGDRGKFLTTKPMKIKKPGVQRVKKESAPPKK